MGLKLTPLVAVMVLVVTGGAAAAGPTMWDDETAKAEYGVESVGMSLLLGNGDVMEFDPYQYLLVGKWTCIYPHELTREDGFDVEFYPVRSAFGYVFEGKVVRMSPYVREITGWDEGAVIYQDIVVLDPFVVLAGMQSEPTARTPDQGTSQDVGRYTSMAMVMTSAKLTYGGTEWREKGIDSLVVLYVITAPRDGGLQSLRFPGASELVEMMADMWNLSPENEATKASKTETEHGEFPVFVYVRLP